MRAVLFLAALLLAGCASKPAVVKEAQLARCEVPTAAIEPLAVPAPLTAGATNEDLRNREQRLEGQLEKCNARLADVPSTVSLLPPKEAPAEPGWLDRLLRRTP